MCVLQVKTKSVFQCVEFYYLSKKLLDKQTKQKEEENKEGELELQKSVRAFIPILVMILCDPVIPGITEKKTMEWFEIM